MSSFPPTLILRHRKENLKKCSLSGLENRADCRFFTYPKDFLPSLSHHILLTLDAPPLSEKDAHFGLFLLDGTWRYAKKMFNQLPRPHDFQCRSIPPQYRSAYPRSQEDCVDPQKGLASVEALFIAYLITGRETEGLLNHYYWKDKFLNENSLFL